MPNRAFTLPLVLVIGASTTATPTAAVGATLTEIHTAQGTAVILRGDLTSADADRLDDFLGASGDHHINALRLDSPGGNLIGSVRLARIVQRHPEVSTMVVDGATCASACFFVFAAGHKKFADYSSLIGIHSVADKFGRVTDETKAATIAMARFSAELGVPAAISELMATTPPDQIAWLSARDLRRMGTVMVGRPLQAPRGSPRKTAPPSISLKVAQASAVPAPVELVRRASNAADKADYETAIRIWRELAAEGHAASQYNLGEMYYSGHGVERDFGEAVHWYARAAQNGISRAQLSLGLAYALGRGTPRDLTQADKWLHIAMASDSNGSEQPRILQARAIVETRMSTTELAEASQQAHDWISSHRFPSAEIR